MAVAAARGSSEKERQYTAVLYSDDEQVATRTGVKREEPHV